MSEHHVLGFKWPKGTRLRVKTELMGGSLLETLETRQEGDDQVYKVKLTAEAFEALRGLRSSGETVQQAAQRLIFAAAAGSTTSLQANPGAGTTDHVSAPTPTSG